MMTNPDQNIHDNQNQGTRDRYLLSEIVSGNESAIKELYERYHLQLFNYIFRIITNKEASEEIMQDVFLAVWTGAKRFKAQSSVKTWLFRIAHHKTVSWLRKTRRAPQTTELLDSIAQAENKENDPARLAADKDMVHRLLAVLSPRHREVIELSFFYRFSYREIASILGCPVGTVKSRMSYAIRHLSRELEKQEKGYRKKPSQLHSIEPKGKKQRPY